MNAHHDELERMLGRDLHRQVDGMVDVPFDFRDVKGRAGRIRRNRRIAAGVGVAAALAVIVPTALTSGGLLQGTQEIEPAPSPSRSVSPPPDVPVEVSRTTLTLDGLSRGDAPVIEYFTPDGVVLPGEGTQELPEDYEALVPSVGDGTAWIAFASGEALFLTEDFEQRASSASGGVATTPGREYVALTMPQPGAQNLVVQSTTDDREAAFWEFPEDAIVEPVGILGPDSVVYRTRSSDGQTRAGLANPDGSTSELPFAGAFSADPVNGLVAVHTDVRDIGGCFGVVEAATLELAWETCDYRLGTFSPDGTYVMAIAADSDGAGPTMLSVLDARTGDLVAEFSSQGRNVVTVLGPVWETSGTIVASAGEGNSQTLVRLGVDGTLEQVAEQVQGSVVEDRYYRLGEDRTVL